MILVTGDFMRTFLLKAKHFFKRNIYPITITVCTVLVLGIITISAYNSLKNSNEVITQTNNQNVVENLPNADVTDDVPTGANPDFNEPEPSKPVVKEIVFEISQQAFDSQIDLAFILSKSGYSEDYIRSCFKKITGKTPNEFLTDIRIKHACFLIDIYKNKISLSEISERCGYLDYIYFFNIEYT